MEEIVLRLGHGLPFNNVSRDYPRVTFYRWCNSVVDYLEFHADHPSDLDAVERGLPVVVSRLHSRPVYSLRDRQRLDVMVRCRCTPANSTVQMTERSDCLWKAPVAYAEGRENLTVLAITPEDFRGLLRRFRRVGEVDVVRRSQAAPDLLRDSYTLSLASLFGKLSEQQLRVLLDALDMGYFDVPKRTSLERVGAGERLRESTVQEHLSKAESKVLRALGPYLRLYRSSRHPAEVEQRPRRRPR